MSRDRTIEKKIWGLYILDNLKLVVSEESDKCKKKIEQTFCVSMSIA